MHNHKKETSSTKLLSLFALSVNFDREKEDSKYKGIPYSFHAVD